MLKKTLIIAALIFAGMINLQATEENEKNPAVGALVCNNKETIHLNNKELEKNDVSNIFSACTEKEKEEKNELACQQEDNQDLNDLEGNPNNENQIKLLACKDCR